MVILLAAWLLAAVGPDLSSPKASVQSFVAAFNENDLEGVCACVEGGLYGKQVQKFEQNRAKSEVFAKVLIEVEIFGVQTEQDDAKVECEVDFAKKADPEAAKEKHAHEFLKLHHDGDGWRIVPLAASELEELVPKEEKPDLTERPWLGVMATAFSNDELMAGMLLAFGREQAKREAIYRMKRIELDLLMYSADKDGAFPKAGEDMKVALGPYTKDPTDLDSFDDRKGVRWVFNKNFCDHNDAEIAKPNKTVLIYEEDQGQLGFRYAGMALVGLADGSSRYVTREESLQLIWQP